VFLIICVAVQANPIKEEDEAAAAWLSCWWIEQDSCTISTKAKTNNWMTASSFDLEKKKQIIEVN
jgi:hypothetical protein